MAKIFLLIFTLVHNLNFSGRIRFRFIIIFGTIAFMFVSHMTFAAKALAFFATVIVLVATPILAIRAPGIDTF